MKLNTKFDINQTVKLIPLNCSCRIISICIALSGFEYKVQYFLDGKQEQSYVIESELQEYTT